MSQKLTANAPSIRRVVVVAVLMSLVTACGRPNMQRDLRKTTQEYEQDSYECQRTITFWIFDRDIYKSCMKGRGHTD